MTTTIMSVLLLILPNPKTIMEFRSFVSKKELLLLLKKTKVVCQEKMAKYFINVLLLLKRYNL